MISYIVFNDAFLLTKQEQTLHHGSQSLDNLADVTDGKLIRSDADG